MKKKPVSDKRDTKVRSGRPPDQQIAEKRGKAFALLYEKHLAKSHRVGASAEVADTIVRSSDLGAIATNNKSKRAILDDVAAFASLIRQGPRGSLFVPKDVYYHERLFVKRHLKEAVAKKEAELAE